MSILRKTLKIESGTTGFPSPAAAHVGARLDLNELLVRNIYTTFYFKYAGPTVHGIRQGSIVVVDKARVPKQDDLVVVVEKQLFKIRKYKQQTNIWGRVSWILQRYN
ncbi:MAG: hypothetical protein RLZ12_621 [Bacillota bacterium]|jgi:SOS-response transcriptional repressor LexA